MEIIFQIEEFLAKHKEIALCIIVGTKGSTPRKAGSKMLVAANGNILGSVGGGKLEMLVIEQAKQQITEGKPTCVFISSEKNVETGSTDGVEIYIEPIGKRASLYIFGAGHVGRALAFFASKAGFRVTLLDFRTLNQSEIEGSGCKLIQGDYFQTLETLDFGDTSYIAIMTPSHEDDFQLLKLLGKKKFAYLGMIGSTRKVSKARTMLVESGHFTPEEFNRFDAPMGIPMKAETPEEIAISILAKLIDIKNRQRTNP